MRDTYPNAGAESRPVPAWITRPRAMENLRIALLASTWGSYGPDVQMEFRNNGTASHHGIHGHWTIASPRMVILSLSDGDTMYLYFNAELAHNISLDRSFGGDRSGGGQ